MGKGNDSYDPVVHRTLYYERIRRDNQDFLLFQPVYSVTYPGLPSMALEPTDCRMRVQGPDDTDGNSSMSKYKDVNEVREWDAKVAQCRGTEHNIPLTLHAFNGWPR